MKAGYGKKIRAYRKGNGLTLITLAKRIGISHSSLSEIENEKTQPSADTLLALMRETRIDFSDNKTEGRERSHINSTLDTRALERIENRLATLAKKTARLVDDLSIAIYHVGRNHKNIVAAHKAHTTMAKQKTK